MNKKITNTLLILAGLLFFNIGSQYYYQRFDLTKDKRYTLSEITKKSLNKITKPIFIKVYLEGDFPPEFNRLQIETRQFLEELSAKNNLIRIYFINPNNHREALIKKGMMPSQLTVEEEGKLSEAIIFPWAEINYGPKTEIVSLLPTTITKSQEEQLQKSIENLEYSFGNALYTIVRKNQPKIAILRGNGQLQNPYLYSFLSGLSKKYRLAEFTLDSVAKNPQKTLEYLTSFDLAILAKPTQKFTLEEKFTLDQFITNGGKTIWMIDNVQADQDSLYNNGKMLVYPRDLNLTDLLFAYGVRINSTLVKDLYASKIRLATGKVGNQTQFQSLNWGFNPLVKGNPNHPITKNNIPVRLRFATQIDTLQNNIKKTPLLVSSSFTQKIGIPRLIDLQSIAIKPREEDYKDGSQLFAVLLEGRFNSAYKNRIKPFTTSIYKENSPPNKMLVIADGDIGSNQILKQKPYPLSIDKWTHQQFGNKDFLLNAVAYLLDDTGVITLRNKTLQINILDKQKAFKEQTFWQFLNIILPLIMLFIFGFIFNYYRKKRYS